MSSAHKSRVLVFGTFDLLHKGHRAFLRQAADLGDYLLVVVARNRTVTQTKGRPPVQTAVERLAGVLSFADVDEARLADKNPKSYKLLSELTFDVLAVGYDQVPDDGEIMKLLRQAGKHSVRLVRLSAFAPHTYKTSRIRDTLAAWPTK